MSALTETGPVLPPRGAVHRQAKELVALARLAEELSCDGPRADLHRAVRQLERMRAILSAGAEAEY